MPERLRTWANHATLPRPKTIPWYVPEGFRAAKHPRDPELCEGKRAIPWRDCALRDPLLQSACYHQRIVTFAHRGTASSWESKLASLTAGDFSESSPLRTKKLARCTD